MGVRWIFADESFHKSAEVRLDWDIASPAPSAVVEVDAVPAGLMLRWLE
jgi:hypothetical protein